MSEKKSARRCVIFYHKHKKNFRHKVRTKMTQRRADIKLFFNTTTDIKSFFQTDIKSEQIWHMSARHKINFEDRPKVRTKMKLRQPTLCRFKNRHKVKKKTQRRLICQTNINSQKRKQRRVDTKSFLKDRCKVRKKRHNVGPT
jgi:hypothetical protein